MTMLSIVAPSNGAQTIKVASDASAMFAALSADVVTFSPNDARSHNQPSVMADPDLSLIGSKGEERERSTFEKLFGPLEFKTVAETARTPMTDAIETYQSISAYGQSSVKLIDFI